MTISRRARDFVEQHSDVYKMRNTIAGHRLIYTYTEIQCYIKYLEQLYIESCW
jgi:hypothetical protein